MNLDAAPAQRVDVVCGRSKLPMLSYSRQQRTPAARASSESRSIRPSASSRTMKNCTTT